MAVIASVKRSEVKPNKNPNQKEETAKKPVKGRKKAEEE